jgi:hypothetical protein
LFPKQTEDVEGTEKHQALIWVSIALKPADIDGLFKIAVGEGVNSIRVLSF